MLSHDIGAATVASDQMIDVAYSSSLLSGAGKLVLLRGLGAEVDVQMTRDWRSYSAESPERTVAALQNAATNACMPSLMAAAERLPQTKAIAATVTGNLASLFEDICTSSLVSTRQNERSDHGHLLGTLNELAILGVLWSGVASGRLGNITHISPTTNDQDRGFLCGGAKTSTACDFVLRYDSDRQQPVQAKLQGGIKSKKANSRLYIPETAMIYGTDLVEGSKPHLVPFLLMGALVMNDEPMLSYAASQIRREVNRARERKRQQNKLFDIEIRQSGVTTNVLLK
jgi:hypothetical protein